MHWLEKVVDELEVYLAKKGKKGLVVVSGGLSVSGLQHIGRLRGEVIVSEVVRRLLRKRGHEAKQYLVLYTQDAWKGKEAQLREFGRPEDGRRYLGWPLIRVPDPYGCHSNWVEHYWEDFGGYLDRFTDGEIEVVTTTELYMTSLKPIVRELIAKREKLRQIMNKYRGRNPYPEGWIPFEPVCERCGRIDTTRSTRYDEASDEVEYVCELCGYRGRAPITMGKLNWRAEWASIWKALGTDFEPFGKDHATPGGSRDSCVDISVNVLGNVPPMGLPYEWVSLRVGGKEVDMGSSDFLGITPKDWYEVAEPELLRFVYLRELPKRKIVIDLTQVPQYYEEFFRAERAFYSAAKEGLEAETAFLAKTYELSLLRDPPPGMPLQASFLTLALAVQLVPWDNLVENVLRRLRSSGIIRGSLSNEDVERLVSMIRRARAWVERHAPDHLRFSIVEHVDESVVRRLAYRSRLIALGEELLRLEEWSEASIKETMIAATRDLNDEERKQFYKEFYMLTIGRESGPRAASLLEVLGKDFVRKRFVEDLCKA